MVNVVGMKKYDTYIAVTGQARKIKPTTMKDTVMVVEQTSVTMHGVTPLRLGRTIYGVGGSILCCLMNLVYEFKRRYGSRQIEIEISRE